MLDELRRVALVTSGVAELTRNRAEQIVRDLVKSGDVRRDKASGTVKELLTFARENRREVLTMLRDEVRSQIEGLGVVTKRDIERLERRIKRLEDRSESAPASNIRSSSKKTMSPKKSTAKKSTAKKSTTRKSSARRTSASGKKAAQSKTPKTRGTVSEKAAENAGGSNSGSDGS